MRYEFAGRNFKLILSSFLATLISLIISAGISRYVPVPLDAIEEKVSVFNTEEVYSIEELDKAEEKMKDKIRQYKEKNKGKGFFTMIKAVKKRSVWISWLPWFVLPFFLMVKNYSTVLILVLLPSVIMFTGLILPVEVIIYSTAMCLGIYLRNLLSRGMVR